MNESHVSPVEIGKLTSVNEPYGKLGNLDALNEQPDLCQS